MALMCTRLPPQVLGAASTDRCIPLGRNGVPVLASYGGGSRRGAPSQRSRLRQLPEEYDSDGSSSLDSGSVATSLATLPRHKDETAEEKRARKNAVKDSKVSMMLCLASKIMGASLHQWTSMIEQGVQPVSTLLASR
jgi:hypothetical protein